MKLLLLGAALAAAASAGVAAAAPAEYRNPTAGRELSLQIAGMHRAPVQRGLVYRRVAGQALRMDVYRPRGSLRRALPAVLVGGPPRFRAGRTSGQKVGWSQAIAASGLAAVTFDHRSDSYGGTPGAPSTDVAAALAYVRAHGRRLGIDGSRLCTLGFSMGTAPWHLWAAMKRPDPSVRCNVSFYGPLDLTQPGLAINRRLAQEYSALTYLRRDGPRIAPMLVAKAGRETNPGFNEAIDSFVAEAARLGAPVRLVTHATGGHAFDVAPRNARSRAVIREALGFLRRHLAATRSLASAGATPRLPRLTATCLTRAERGRAVGMRASDGTRTVGVIVGSGPRGVVLVPQARTDLCIWMRHARRLAGRGLRVLAFDPRGHGSSQSARRPAFSSRIDLDVRAAARELRRRGATSVVLVGASLGGTAVLTAAAAIVPPVAGVVSLSAPRLWRRMNALAAAPRLTVPTLYVAGAEDEPFPTDARALHAASPSPAKQLEIVPGPDHGVFLLLEPAVRRLVDDWIVRRAADPPRALAAAAVRRPAPLRLRHRCVTPAERQHAVRFTASDATRLIGVMFGSGSRAVVLAHQGGGAPPNLCSWTSYARRLAGRGYRVLALDHRRFGSSGVPPRRAYTSRVDLDVAAAVRELRRRGAASVVLAGASLGGAGAVAAAASVRPAVQGVVSLSTPRFYRSVDALGAARRLTVPVLFVAAVEDEPAPTDARALFAASPSADKRLEIFPGFEHGAPMLRDPAVGSLVDGWIAAHSPPAPAR